MPVRRVQVTAPPNVGKEVHGLRVAVGFFPGAKYEDGTPIAYVASVHEFGLGVTPRPFFRPAIDAGAPTWIAAMVQALRKGAIPHSAATVLGSLAMGDVQAQIAQVTTPPLDPKTIKARQRRGNSSKKPLVDTRILLPSVQFEVTQ